ncbi:unnamed protein product [Thelazia callipaeda]|uniref:DUF148 domain-containing protein n=1 Tax=Thelazia callipaeda TaxID=103827 RepID=A0A0N5DB37_THECL|nr:unnamed protein product [Thelazia callipaeda]
MLPISKAFGQRKHLIFFVLSMIITDKAIGVTKQQIAIGQYYFSQTATIPNYGWSAETHSSAEPIYDDTLSQSKQKQHNGHYKDIGRSKTRLYPIPAKIFYKNRFKLPRKINAQQKTLVDNQQKFQITQRNTTKLTTESFTRGERIVNVLIRMNVEDSKATVFGEVPFVVLISPNQVYREFTKNIISDHTEKSFDSSYYKLIRLIERFQGNTKSLASDSLMFSEKLDYYQLWNLIMQIRKRLFHDNAEVLNQILHVREDINSFKQDIGKVKKFLQQIYFSNETLASSKINNYSEISANRLHPSFAHYPRKLNTYVKQARPLFIAFAQMANNNKSSVGIQLEKMPVLKKNKSRNEVLKYRNSRNITFLSEFMTKQKFANKDVMISGRRKLLKILPINKEKSAISQGVAPDLMVNLSSQVEITSIPENSRKFLGFLKPEIIKNETLNARREESLESKLNTLSSNNFFEAVPLLSDHQELPIISVTEAYRPFTFVRLTAKSRINFSRGSDNSTLTR